MFCPVREGSSPIPLSQLREIVEAALDVPVLATTAGRDAVLQQLRPQLASMVARQPTARLDIMNIVQTVARYPGGLTELVEAIDFLDRGSIAMDRLTAVIAEVTDPPEA
jgi:Effector-associated domain 2